MSADISSCVYLYLRTLLNLIVFTKFDNYFIVKYDRKKYNNYYTRNTCINT